MNIKRIPGCLSAVLALASIASVSAEAQPIPKHDGKPADMTKPVQVFISMGQSNRVGTGQAMADLLKAAK